jgi:ParB/RepB/Spo0J family partition protein
MFAALKDVEIERGFNVRRASKPDDELIQSIKENGVIRPIHVRWKNRKKDKFYLIDGQRRYLASKSVGLGSIPIVQHGFIGDKEALIISLTSNDHQKKLSKKEQFEGFRRLKAEGLTANQISKVMAVAKRTVEEAFRIQNKGSKDLKAAAEKSVKKGGIHSRVAARASSLPKREQRKILPKVKGKKEKEAIQELRKVEKRIGIRKTGPKPKQTAVPKKSTNRYKLAEDAAERCEKMETLIRKKLRHSPTHRVLSGQLLIIEVLKGKMNVTDVYGWDDVK